MADDPYFSSPQYAELCRLFREQLPARLTEAGQAWVAAAGAGEGGPAIESLKMLGVHLHQLSGTAKSFGSPGLGAEAQALEQTIRAIVGRGGGLSDGERTDIAGRLRSLFAIAEEETSRAGDP
jgi:HPt (histidine-containing phosphotransfer) domain-containing protein